MSAMDPAPGLRGLVGKPETINIVVVDYDPEWPRRFDVERTKILQALGARALAVEHVGSTSVPRLAAKPIVDVNVTVADSSDEQSYLPDLVAAGYELRVREPEWYEHRMLRTSTGDVHVHVFSVGSPEIVRIRVFATGYTTMTVTGSYTRQRSGCWRSVTGRPCSTTRMPRARLSKRS